MNVEKSKVIKFRKGGRREKRMSWWWKEERIKEVKSFKYLGFISKKNGGMETYIRDRIKREAAVMGQVWGIGKRRFWKD